MRYCIILLPSSGMRNCDFAFSLSPPQTNWRKDTLDLRLVDCIANYLFFG
jgi:hypothetical protein